MREDMHKVVIERPRWGSSRRSRKTRISLNQYDPAREYDFAARESSSWDWYPDRKHFSDHLAPIRRYLEKQVGRPWRKVEGELAAALDLRTVVGRHLLSHVEGEVAIHCRIDADGRVFRRNGDWEIEGLYVHPRTGLLRRTKPRRFDAAAERRRRIEQADEVDLDATTRARRIDGIWYLFSRAARVEEVVACRRDATGRLVRHFETRQVEDKRQASRTDIRRIRAALETSVR